MTKITQYSTTDPSAISGLEQYGFIGKITGDEIGVTSLNKVRIFLEEVFGISAISKNLIRSLLNESGGQVVGEGIDTNMNICTLIFIDIDGFKARVNKALLNGEIRKL